MTDHLPECHTSMIPDFHNERWICICDQLRACEQRVNSSNLTMWNRTQEQAQHIINAGIGIAWKDGFKDGLEAAREAVDSMVIDTVGNSAAEHLRNKAVVSQAIAAIDALRKDKLS